MHMYIKVNGWHHPIWAMRLLDRVRMAVWSYVSQCLMTSVVFVWKFLPCIMLEVR